MNCCSSMKRRFDDDPFLLRLLATQLHKRGVIMFGNSVLPIKSIMFGLGALAFTCGMAQADWTLFRNDAFQTGFTKEQLNDKTEILWTYKAKDAVESTGAIVEGKVIFGCGDGTVICLDLSNGTEKWKYTVEGTPSFKAS